MSDAVIEFQDVWKSYPTYHTASDGFKHFLLRLPKMVHELHKESRSVLEAISFQVKRGESLGLVGRNGAGKSTTLSLISRIIKQDKGRIFVNGWVVPMLELGFGFHRELTGRDNVILNGILLGLTYREIRQKLDAVIDFSELRHMIDEPVRTYSAGMVHRLGFSVVANLKPDILLIDEILAVGDLPFHQKCIDTIERFQRNGVTIIFVSHNRFDLTQVCDRILWIEDHRLRMMGPTEEVLEAYSSFFPHQTQSQWVI